MSRRSPINWSPVDCANENEEMDKENMEIKFKLIEKETLLCYPVAMLIPVSEKKNPPSRLVNNEDQNDLLSHAKTD